MNIESHEFGSEDGGLRGVLRSAVESWMDVLIDGLSPEILNDVATPVKLVSVRSGGQVPAGSYDAILIRADSTRSDRLETNLRVAMDRLRAGGRLLLIALDGPPSEPVVLGPDADQRQVILPGRILQDGAWVASLKKVRAGRHDLVGLRRNLRALEANILIIEEECTELRGRAAERRPLEGGLSLKEWIGHLGDLDRHGYLPIFVQAVEEQGGVPPTRDSLRELLLHFQHQRRPLAELVIRFRHFRTQSLEWLDKLLEEEWLLSARDLDGNSAILADLVRQWFREESLILRTIKGLAASGP